MSEQTGTVKQLCGKRHVPSTVLYFLLALTPASFLYSQTDLQNAAALLAAGTICKGEEEYLLAKELLSRSAELALMEKDTSTAIAANYHLAQAKFWLSNYQGANECLYLLLNDFPKKLNRIDSMAILRMVSQNHFYMGNYDVAHEIALMRLRATELVQDSYNLGLSYQVLSEIEVRQKDYGRALNHVLKSSAIFEQMNLPQELSFNLDLLGDIYHHTGRYKEALSYKIQSCQLVDTTGSLYNNAYCNHTIALTLAKMGRFNEAVPLFNLALATFERAGLPEETAMTKACLGEAQAQMGQCDKGIALLEKALADAEQLSMSPLRRDVLEKLVQANKTCGQIEAAFFYIEKFMAVNDSLNNQNTKVRIASLSNQYELEKKSAEVEALVQMEKERMRFIVALLAGLALLFGFLVISYYSLKKQRSYSRQLDAKSKQIAQQFEEIHLANEKLKSANKELEQFAYIASHDLKAPLRTIGNYAALINRRYTQLLDENGVAFLKFITEAAKHMNALLEDIFAYSNLGKTNLELETVNLQEKLDLSLRLLHETIQLKSAKLTSDPLPLVTGNPTQLYQLIQNLLENALKFVPPDRKPEITIRVSNDGNLHHFELQDNGIGIPSHKLEEVFTIFKRLHSKEAFKGTGIGLAICKKIVEGHGGNIWVESDGETGCTFHFTLQKTDELKKNPAHQPHPQVVSHE